MKLPIAFYLLLLLAAAAGAQESPLVAESALAAGWRIERPDGPDAPVARLTAPGGGGVRLQGLPPEAPLELHLAPGGGAVALLVHHRKYTDLLAWREGSDGTLAEEVLPLLPAAEILRDYPTGGKPPTLRKPQLTAMKIERAGWGSGRRLAARVRFYVVDEASGETGWSYVVDAVWSLPPAASPPGAKAVLTILNVVLQPPC